jgi:EAL domain-containing protein (putative c-di-GMP-specific phosphodiesterase class I)
MWNYSFTLPSAMILLILVVFYFRRPRLPIRMNRTFLALLLIDALTLLADFASSRVDEVYTLYPISICYLANLAFFVLFLARIYVFFLFVLDVLENHQTLPDRVRRIAPVMFLVSELIALSSPFTHAVFYMDAGGYHRGPGYNVLYVCFFWYLAFAAWLILRHQRALPRGAHYTLITAVLILVLGNIVRMLFPQLLVMNTFFLMTILVLYLAFENPDLFLSDRGSAFNMRAFGIGLTEWCRKDSYRLLAFIIRDYSEMRGIYGGLVMDQCIIRVSDFLTGSYPDCPVFYLRNGVFAVIGEKSMDVRCMSEEIAERFRKPWLCGGTEILLKPTFVKAELEKRDSGADQVIGKLQLALESAGRAEYGEDRTAPLSLHIIDQYLADKHTLDAALESETERIEVYLQPLMESSTGRLVAAEALSRLHAEDGRMLSPAVFIPIAEKSGSIIALGEQVLRKTCRFIRDNDIAALGLQWINVNLSPYQCMSPTLAERFKAILEEYGVAPALIHLELTEQSIADYELIKPQLLALEEIGFQFALDDYGSGASNLTRVKQFPFKNIKIDMEVVRNYFRDRDPLLPTLVQVFRQMDFSITAEGIETKEMAEGMREIGCDYLQGFYFSQPVPMQAFLQLYAKKSSTGAPAESVRKP